MDIELEKQYFSLGLYSKVTDDKDYLQMVKNIKWDEDTYDGFCKGCSKSSVFKAIKNIEINHNFIPCLSGNGKNESLKCYTNAAVGDCFGGAINFEKRLICTRCGFFIHIYYKYDNAALIKVGSYPSVADLQIGCLLNELSIPKHSIPKELTKAIGLKAHGAYIGAFSYLRRVYENLIVDAATKASKEVDWNEGKFNSLRAQDKIKYLEKYLPLDMVENRSAYGILSKGIHELSEEECNSNFNVLYDLIIMIIEEKEEQKRKGMRKEKLRAALSEISTNLK